LPNDQLEKIDAVEPSGEKTDAVEQSGEKIDAVEPSGEKIDDWVKIGFHRPLAGIFYNLIFILIAAGFGVMLTVWFIPNLVFPFPAGIGYQQTVFNMFSLLFTVIGAGTSNALQRYVAEENIKNPKNSIAYLQFYTWYHLITGLFQTTGISMWAIFYVPQTNLSYAAWFIAVYSTVQYPGQLWVFQGALQSYQRYDKANLVGFIQIQIFQNVMQIIFIFIFRYIGVLNPALGEMMGATIGSLIGFYLKDFVAAFLSAYFLAPVLRQIDPSYKIRDLFRYQFDRKVVKNCLSFGMRAMLSGLIYPAANLVGILLVTTYMQNYASLLGMYTLGTMLSQMVVTFQLNITTTISESYLNGKIKLSQYYVAQAYKWNFVTGFFMVGLLFNGSLLLGIIVGSNYFLVVPIVQINIFFQLAIAISSLNDGLFQGVSKPEINILLTGIEQSTYIGMLYVMLVWFHSDWPALVFPPGVGMVVRAVAGIFYFDKKVFHLKGLSIWQSLISPGIAAIVEAVYILAMINYVLPYITGFFHSSIVGAILGIVVGIFTGPFFIYFPVLAFFGGFDDDSLRIIEKTAAMSGPSKFLVNLIKAFCIAGHRISPFKNHFKIDATGVEEEIEELMILRKNNLLKK